MMTMTGAMTMVMTGARDDNNNAKTTDDDDNEGDKNDADCAPSQPTSAVSGTCPQMMA